MINVLLALTLMMALPESQAPVVYSDQIEMAADAYTVTWLDTKITESEFDLLCRTVHCEAGLEPEECMKMVAITILNRMASDLFPGTIRQVIYADNAYTVTERADFETVEYFERVEEQVFIAITEYSMYPRDMYYFRNAHYHNFGRPYKNVGYTYFSTQE